MHNIDTRPKTIFCDIDGTLVYHVDPVSANNVNHKMILLPGTLEKFREWDKKGYNLILVTGRRESMREITEKQLRDTGIIYDQLIMGISGGERHIINDCKPNSNLPTAFAISIERNKGIGDVVI